MSRVGMLDNIATVRQVQVMATLDYPRLVA
jgi:hypothetical protein